MICISGIVTSPGDKPVGEFGSIYQNVELTRTDVHNKYIVDSTDDALVYSVDRKLLNKSIEMGDVALFVSLVDQCSMDEILSHGKYVSILRWVCTKGRLTMLVYLCYKGLALKDIILRDNEALRCACRNGHLTVVKHLCSMGLTSKDIRSLGNCALMDACRNGHLPVVKHLCSMGLTLDDIRSRDNYALRGASTFGHTQVVEYLKSTGATLD